MHVTSHQTTVFFLIFRESSEKRCLLFMLDEKFLRNASKFAIFYIQKPKVFFPFRATLFLFSLMNALSYVNIDQGIY